MLHQKTAQFRFKLGDKVRAEVNTDEGLSYSDIGYVIGRAMTIPDALIPGNWYLIEFVEMPKDSHLSAGHIDWEHEMHLFTICP